MAIFVSMTTPIHIEITNGKSVHIRTATPSDAESLNNTVREYLADSDYIPKLASEFTASVEDTRRWITSFIDADNSTLLVAEYDGKIIGNIDLTGSTRVIMRHTAVIGMGMLKQWRGKGLGTALMKAAIAWAESHEIIETLWLQVYHDNVAGTKLYTKMGFEKTGLIKDFFKHEGKYHDVITMSRKV